MRKRRVNFEVWPAPMETIVGFSSCDVEGVIINAIDLRERLDEINGVALISRKLRPNRMRIDCDPQSLSPVRVSLLALCCCRSLRLVGLMAARIALANTCRLTAQASQVVKLG